MCCPPHANSSLRHSGMALQHALNLCTGEIPAVKEDRGSLPIIFVRHSNAFAVCGSCGTMVFRMTGLLLLYQQAAEVWLEQGKLQLLVTESRSALNAWEPPS